MLGLLIYAISQTLVAPPAVQAKPSTANSKSVDAKSLELNERGVRAVKNGKNFEAEQLFRSAITRDPLNLTAVLNLSATYVSLGKENAARSLLEDYVKKVDNNAGLHLRLGDVYFGSQKVRSAAQQYEKAYKLDPTLPHVAAKLGTIYSMTGEMDKAESFLMKAVKESPQNSQMLGSLSSVQLANGKARDSIRSAKQSIQIKATSEVYITLGTAYEQQNDLQNSLIAFERARELGDKRPELSKKIEAIRERVEQDS